LGRPLTLGDDISHPVRAGRSVVFALELVEVLTMEI